jgi:hypothetical protein
MANILDFLRTVLVDEGAQRSFRHDPAGYLKEGGFGDLTGEDVAEAMNVLRRSLPEPVAAGLAPFGAPDGTEGIPPFRPVGVETELDAAARVLAYAIDECPAPVAVAAPSWAPPPPPADTAEWGPPPSPDQERHESPDAAGSADTGDAPTWDLLPPPPASSIYDADREDGTGDDEATPGPGAPVEPNPFAAEAEPEPHVEPEPSPPVEPEHAAPVAEAPVAEPSPAGPSFGEALDAAVLEARTRHEEAIRQYTDASGRTTRDLAERLDALVQEAQARAGDITSAAQASVSQLQEEAEATRRQGEEEARTIVEQARREADEIRAAAQAEAEAARQDIDARRAALRDAEEQLKEKFSGIEGLFRQVLHTDEGSAASGDPSGEHHQ